jgi:hypothetical protein
MQREMKAQMAQLNDALSRSQNAERMERDQAERMRAELLAERSARAAAEAAMAAATVMAPTTSSSSRRSGGIATGASNKRAAMLYSNQSSDSASSTTAGVMPRSRGSVAQSGGPRASMGPSGGSTPQSRLNTGDGLRMTPEEKHIRRMRQVMIKREQASGLPSRCARSFLCCTITCDSFHSYCFQLPHVVIGSL